MDDSDGDAIYILEVVFPAGAGKIVRYKYTAYLAQGNWIWENFVGKPISYCL